MQHAQCALINGKGSYNNLLAEYPEITRPGARFPTVDHHIKHYIHVMSASPEAYRLGRMAPDRLKAAKRESETMVRMSIVPPLSSSWPVPLHLVLKSDKEWTLCGDYRALNSRTVRDRYPVRHIHGLSHSLKGKKIF